MAIFKVTAVPDFSQLKGEIAKLQSSPVTLGVNTQNADVQINATRQSLQKLTETFSPEGELRRSVADYSRQVGEVVQVSKSLNMQSGEMEITSKKVTQNFTAQAKAAERAAAQVRAAKDAYRAYAAQQSSTYAPTAMQSRIEDLTGVSGLSGKSAKESAAVFEKAYLDASGKVQQSTKKAAQSVRNVGTAAKESSGFADLMGYSFGRVAAKMALWQVMGNAIAGVKRSFVEALDTMKSVDDEMVTIRKVTRATTEELNRIEKQAYDTASAYGVAADEYLNSVANFSRAGYGEQASALAELATKTQIVGDTDAETAQQFLLSMDAAYKYQGSIEQLTKVLDGANEIDNNYATSIEKIAEGLGKVAPIAAQAHVGADELTAAIGTITAVTQRSGTEAATALRALFLNIIGDTKTEIDEGVTWTTGEIAGLRDVIKVYAKDAYDAAQATGSVINPMKAIAGLSQSMKDGLLTEQQLMEMVSDIGGKLRTSQLLALIQNWDMYQSMLSDFAGAAGSADKEVENALDSWTRKTEILNNKWTQFISHLVETDTIKGALDGVIGLVELLDTDVGRFVITVAALTTGVTALGKGLSWIKGTELIKNGKALVGIFADIANGAGSFSDVLTLINPKILIVVAAVAALYGAYKLVANYVEKANRTLASFDEEIGGVNSQLESNKKRIEEINNMPWADRTSAILEEKAALEKENAELEKKLKLLDKEKTERAREIVKETVFTGEMVTVSHKGTTSGSMSTTFEKTVAGAKAYEFLTEQLNEYSAALEKNGEIADSVRDQYEKDIAASARMVEALKQMQDAGDELTDEQLRLIAAYDSFTSASDKAQNATKQYVSNLVEEARQSGATGKALYDLVAAQIAASSQGLNFSQQIAALQELGYQAGLTAQQVAMATGMVGTYQDQRNIERTVKSLMETEGLTRAQAEARVYANMQHALWTGISQNGGWGGSTGGYSGGGTSGSSAAKNKYQDEIDALEKQRDAELAAIDAQIDALKKQNEEIDRAEKLEELRLEVMRKQNALLNARNERTVRQYNAATGQWEWVADPSKVKKAEEDLEDAKKDLRDYEREVELDLAIEELEARKKAIEAAYQLQIEALEEYIDQLGITVADEKALLDESLENLQDYVDERNRILNSGWVAAPSYGSVSTGAAGNTADRGMSSGQSPNTPQFEYNGENTKWAGGRPGVTNSESYLPKKDTGSGGSNSKVSQRDIERTAKGLVQTGKYKDYNAALKEAKRRAGVYDSGGVLRGMGGIKATMRDEMVLPPDVTAKMLKPSADARFRARVNELGGLYGETPVSHSVAGSSDNRSYSDHSGPTYNVKGITLTEQQAQHLTVAQMCRMAHNVKPYGG